MIKNYFKSAWNSLKRNRFFFSLNILGLAVGMATFLLVAQYVRFERSYENFIPDKENIYRVKLDSRVSNEQMMSTAENYPGVGPALKDNLPEVTAYARLYNAGYKNNVVITYRDAKPEPKAIKPKRFLYADSAFLPMMGYMLLKGNALTALAEPMTAVISEKYATLYFGSEDPLGKTLVMQDDDFNHEQVRVTGVFKDLPDNTHLKFDVLFAYKTLFGRGDEAYQRYDLDWHRNDMYTFVKLMDGTDPKTIEARLPAIVNKHKPGLKESEQRDILNLQRLTDIHLKSALAEEAESNGNDRIVMFMTIIGLFVLVIAWINYINLATARAVERSKEVGVRKVVGASKSQLVTRFLIESALVNLLSIIVALFLVTLGLPYFNTISGLSLTSSSISQPWFILTLVLLWISGTFLSGIYPAFVLSSFKPVTVLAGKLKYSNQGNLLRKGLVVVQFAASIVLIGGTIITYRQLNYIMHRDLGMNIDQVMVIDRPGIANTDQQAFVASIDLFRNELKKTPSVSGVTTSMTVPGKQREYKPMIKMANGSDSVIVRANSMDYEFLDVFKMKLIAGRNFSPDRHADDRGVIVTESTARSLGYYVVSDIIGESVVIPQFGSSQRVIIGIVNDYHQVSLKKAIDPGIFTFSPYGGEIYSVRVDSRNISQTVADVGKAYTKAFPGNPFEYFFLDEYFNRQYANEQKFGKLFTTFAILAIIIACVGLFGLSAYMASRQVKEIGIRKVLGASVSNVVMLLSKDFVKLVLIAIIIASPIAWWVMSKWLQDFAYRVNISWWVFAIAGTTALLIAMVTVSFQAIKAAVANPVKSLRTE